MHAERRFTVTRSGPYEMRVDTWFQITDLQGVTKTDQVHFYLTPESAYNMAAALEIEAREIKTYDEFGQLWAEHRNPDFDRDLANSNEDQDDYRTSEARTLQGDK